MKVYTDIKNFKARNPVLTVGVFDGVHLGHKKILAELNKKAKEINGETVVFTLYPHPAKILNPSRKLFMLNTLKEKTELLKQAGVKHFIIYPFTPEFASLSSCEFIQNILHRKLKIKHLTVGYDHRFGKDRQSDFNTLKKCAESFNISITKVDAFTCEGINISSTKIRNALLSAETEKANKYLGYEYFLTGKIISGNKIGRTIGFPTANIKIREEKLIPKNGVYAVKVLISGKEYPGMLNIGSRPTVNTEKNLTIEVHIFDFSEKIYDKEITVYFHKFIRNEIKFSGKQALKRQLEKDKKAIKKIF